MKKTVALILTFVMILCAMSVNVFALTKEEANANVSAAAAEFKKATSEKFDLDGSGNVEVSDARTALLASAGLVKGVDTARADVDGDGKVTASDARHILRVAAKLENKMDYLYGEQLAYFNAIINSIKPNAYRYYSQKKNATEKITCDNPALLDDMTKQMADFSKRADMDDEKFDFKEEMTKPGDPTYSSAVYGGARYTSNANYPVKEQSQGLSSTLTADNIAKAVYKTNETYTFTYYNSKGTVLYSDTVTGLDSITVYIKGEKFNKMVPDDTENTITGKVFDPLNKANIDDILAAGADLSNMDGMVKLGKFNIDTSFNYVEYYDSYVTVYFWPETSVPVATVHNLHYDASIRMDMDIHLSVKSMVEGMGDDIPGWLKALMSLGGDILKAKGTENLVNTTTESLSTYLIGNNPNAVYYVRN